MEEAVTSFSFSLSLLFEACLCAAELQCVVYVCDKVITLLEFYGFFI